MPALLSSLINVAREDLSPVLAPDGAPCPCLRGWLARVPDPRSPLGRWHPLEFVLALAVCAFTAAGHDSPSAIADWASGCSQEVLVILGGRRGPWTRQVRPPGERTFRRVRALTRSIGDRPRPGSGVRPPYSRPLVLPAGAQDPPKAPEPPWHSMAMHSAAK